MPAKIDVLKIKRLLIFTMLVTACLMAHAQNPVVNQSTEYIDKLLLRVDELKISDPDNFSLKMQELQSLRDQADQSQLEFIRYFEIYKWVAQGDLEKAEIEFDKLFEQVEDVLVKIRIKLTLANMQAISREYNQALLNLDYAITQIENHSNKVIRSKVNFVTANVYYLLDIYEMSIKYAELVIKDALNDMYMCKANAVKLGSKFKSGLGGEQGKVHKIITLCRENNQLGYALNLTLDWIKNEFLVSEEQGDLRKL